MSSSHRLNVSALYHAVLVFYLIFCQTEAEVCNIEELENGAYHSTSATYLTAVTTGEEITATCDSGYVLYGCQKLRCGDDGTFHPIDSRYDLPFCLDVDECRPATPAQVAEYSLYSLHSSEYYYNNNNVEEPSECGSVFDQFQPIHNCHENARCYNTPGSFVCQCEGDYLGDGVNTCEYDPPECEVLLAPENGYIKINNSKITEFDCDEGYRLQGTRRRTCKRDGWSGVQPECQETGCGDPGTPKDGYKYGTSYEPGSRVTYLCKPDYILGGSNTRVCTEQKRWDGWTPVCKPPKTLLDIAGDIRRDFIDKFELYTDSSRGRSAMGRLSRGNSVGLDLVFAFDKSSSVGRVNFQKGLNFTKRLIEEFGIDHESYGGTRVAAVSFASEAKIEFNYYDDVNTTEKVFRKLDAMENTLGGGTAMKEALEKVRLEIIDDMRNNSKRALFIVTDGHANTEDPVARAEDLRENQGFEIFAVGVGNDVDREQIRTVASVPYTSHVFLLNTFDDLAEVTELIAEKRTDYSRCGIPGDWELPAGTNKANSNAWPWLAHIIREPYNIYCEGALICEQWVVVAASCLDGNVRLDEPYIVPKEKLFVELGNHEVFQNEGCEQNATVAEIHRPPTYSNESLDSDIALLKLDHPLQLVNCIRTICLPNNQDSFNFNPANRENKCYLSGWGSKSMWLQQEQDQIPRFPSIYPHQVSLPLVANSKCERIAGVDLTDNMLCAGDRYKNEDTECTGQAGSPLVCRRDDDSWSMIGVLSDGSGCSEHEEYSYFTKVFNYIDWINQVTESCNAAHVVQQLGGFKKLP